MWTASFSCSLCMKLRSPGFINSFSILATLDVCGRHLSRLPRKHHLLFSWKRNAWWQSRVSKRVDSVCLEYWLVFFRHSISIAWNWTFFPDVSPILHTWHGMIGYYRTSAYCKKDERPFSRHRGAMFCCRCCHTTVTLMIFYKNQKCSWLFLEWPL